MGTRAHAHTPPAPSCVGSPCPLLPSHFHGVGRVFSKVTCHTEKHLCVEPLSARELCSHPPWVPCVCCVTDPVFERCALWL